MQRETDGSVYSFSPVCRCSSRGQRKVGRLNWRCNSCGADNHYRVCGGEFLPFPEETALEIDAGRARAWK